MQMEVFWNEQRRKSVEEVSERQLELKAGELRDAAASLELEEKARVGCAAMIQAGDSPVPVSLRDNIDVVLKSQKLCFESGMLSFATTLIPKVAEEDIGDYTLISLLNGEPDDHYFVIYDHVEWR